MIDDVLVCRFDLRPQGAPSIFDIAPLVARIDRDVRSLAVVFSRATPAVRAYVAAEQRCCPDIGWQYDEPSATLGISATPGTIATLHDMYQLAIAEAGAHEGERQTPP